MVFLQTKNNIDKFNKMSDIRSFYGGGCKKQPAKTTEPAKPVTCQTKDLLGSASSYFNSAKSTGSSSVTFIAHLHILNAQSNVACQKLGNLNSQRCEKEQNIPQNSSPPLKMCKSVSFEINRLDYKSLTQEKRKEYIREIINKIGPCESVKSSHPQLYEILTNDVISVHPRYPEKCNGMVDLAIRNNKKNKKNNLEGWMKFANGKEDNISLNKQCVTGRPKKSEEKLKDAARVAIEPQINAYRKSHKRQPCVKCGILINKMEVDHNFDELTFQTLFENFRDECKIQIPQQFDEDKGNYKCFKPTDSDFEKRWQQYHHDHAILRMLCFDCHKNASKKNI